VKARQKGESHVEQHYVPASFLQHWCGPDGRLVFFHREAGRFLRGRASPKSICKEPDLYTMHGAPSDQAKSIETDFLTPLIDEPGAQVHKQLLAGARTLHNDQMHQWARYIMALKARAPEVVAQIRTRGETAVRSSLQSAQGEYEKIKPDCGPDTLEGFMEPWALKGAHLGRVLPRLIDHDKTRNAIVAMHWRCFDVASGPYELLTCDRPVIWLGGPELPFFVIGLALGPGLGFIAARNDEDWQKIDALSARELAKRFNESTVGSVRKYVYASSTGAQRFVEARLK
jgi:hypothetical protein